MGKMLKLIQKADLSVSQQAARLSSSVKARRLTALSAGQSMSFAITSYVTDPLVKRGLLTHCKGRIDRRFTLPPSGLCANTIAASSTLSSQLHCYCTSIPNWRNKRGR